MASQTLKQLQNQQQTTSDDARLAAMGAQAAALEASAEVVVAARTRDIAGVDIALKRFSPRARHVQNEYQRRQSAPFVAQRAGLEVQLHQARTVASAASYTFSLIAERRREGFSARVLERSASPLSPQFWDSLTDASHTDLARLEGLALDVGKGAEEASEPRGVLLLALAAALALAFLLPIRWWLDRRGRRDGEAARTTRRLPKTARALWVAVVDIGLPALAAVVLHLGAQWGGVLSEKADALAGAGVVAVVWASAILALGRALATDRDARRRLLNVPDHAAGRIQFFLWIVATITGAGFLLTRLNYVIGASVAATIAANCLLSLAYAAIAGVILIALSGGRARLAEAEVAGETSGPAWTLVSLALTTAILITLGAVLAGYTTLAALISNQIFWLSVIAAVTYLLSRFADDLCDALFSGQGWAARVLHALFGLRRSMIGQIGVLVSAGLQILIVTGALSLALTPFGQSGGLLLSHVSQLGQTVHIGSASISPGAIAAGLATLALGVGIVHLVKGWVTRRYLPVTDWDAGVRNSVSTGVGYLGVGVSLVCALAAMGLGFRQIALIASALSVGIGFGLQQIVQNFVSGVILLIERPVKVGDWVSVEGVEGDIRRIRVRATEIETFDRSTVIVPNSDLITKTVQNKTLGEPRGRIQLEISIANPADARKASALILAVAQSKPSVLKDPPPAAYIDSLAGGGAVNFKCFIYVGSPRDVYKTRSDLFYDILEAFEKNDVAFVGSAGPQNIIVEPGPTMRAMLTSGDQSGPLRSDRKVGH